MFTGQLLDGTIESAKVEIGAAGPLFTNSFDFYGHLLTKTWIKGVWNEIWENKLTVKEKTTSLFLKRDNDIFLNKTFLSKGYSKTGLHIIGYHLGRRLLPIRPHLRQGQPTPTILKYKMA